MEFEQMFKKEKGEDVSETNQFLLSGCFLYDTFLTPVLKPYLSDVFKKSSAVAMGGRVRWFWGDPSPIATSDNILADSLLVMANVSFLINRKHFNSTFLLSSHMCFCKYHLKLEQNLKL